jgi:hypothetical protein
MRSSQARSASVVLQRDIHSHAFIVTEVISCIFISPWYLGRLWARVANDNAQYTTNFLQIHFRKSSCFARVDGTVKKVCPGALAGMGNFCVCGERVRRVWF